MADTFKGIITADGKKRQLPYSAVWETPVSDETLSIQGAFADAKVVGNNFKKTKAEIDSLKEDIAAETSRATAVEDTKADKTALARTNRSLDALWKLNQGVSYEFQTDDAETYQKTVPSGAKVANVKSIGGKTIVWNQLVKHIENSAINNVSINTDEKGTFTLNGTSSAVIYLKLNDEKKSIIGHKYYISQKRYPVNSDAYIYNDGGGITLASAKSAIQTATLEKNFYLRCDSDTTFDNVVLKPIIFDLTQMFGSGNEPSTVEEFEAMFPADYYPYNAGELMSASVNEVIYLDTKNQETSYPIPQAILDLDGYGDGVTDNVYNYVDWENKKYHKRVGKYTIDGSEDIYKEESYWVMTVTDFEKPGPSTKNAICVNFKMGNDYFGKWGDVNFRRESNGFVFSDSESKFANSNEVKDYFRQNNETIYYELNEEQIIDISDIIDNTFQEPIEVEAGGTLTFKNSHGDDYRIPIPSSEEYVISLAEVAK